MEAAISIKVFSIIILFTILMLNLRDDFKSEALSKDLSALIIVYILSDFCAILYFGANQWFKQHDLISIFTAVGAEFCSVAIFFIMLLYIKHTVPEKDKIKKPVLNHCYGLGLMYIVADLFMLVWQLAAKVAYPQPFVIVYYTLIFASYLSLWAFIFSVRKFNTKSEQQLLYGFVAMIALDAVLGILKVFSYHGIGSVVLVIMMYITFHQERTKRYIAMERDYNQAQHALLMAQVKPHFMFNTLATIRVLLSVDQEKGLHLLDIFNNYLRCNVDNFDSTELVPFERDFTQLRSYIEIQQVRFPYIKVKYDIKEMDFALPMFVLQPIVENSIKHGLRMKKDGALLTISTDLDPKTGNVVIIIEDNGVGFVESELDLSDRNHIGVKNTRQRIKDLCGGEMIVESEKGVGTKTTILIKAKPL